MSEGKGIRFNPFKRFTKESFHLPHKLARFDGISWPAKAVYGALLRFCGSSQPWVWPELKTLSLELGMSESCVSRHIDTLAKNGFIEVDVDGRKRRYHFLWHAIYGPVPDDISLADSQVSVAEMQVSLADSQVSLAEMQVSLADMQVSIKEGSMTMNHDHEPSEKNLHDGDEKMGDENDGLDGLNLVDMIIEMMKRKGSLVGKRFATNLYEKWMELSSVRESDIETLLKTAINEGHGLDWVKDQISRIVKSKTGGRNGNKVRI